MAVSNGTKQYILNYDSKYLYPYTLLDCIIDSDDPSKIGADAIINQIAKCVQESSDETKGGMVLGIASGNSFSLQKLDTFDRSDNNKDSYKCKYFSGNAQFVDLPGIKFLDNTVKAKVGSEGVAYDINLNNTYFGNESTGLKVAKADGLVGVENTGASLIYFGDGGKPHKYDTPIGKNEQFIYYNGSGGFAASEMNSNGLPVKLTGGVFEKIDPENLTAGNLQIINSGSSVPNIPYILPTDGGAIKYVCPENNGSTETQIFAYMKGTDGEMTLKWTSTTGLTSTAIEPAGVTKNSESSLDSNAEKYYVLGVDASGLGGTNTLYCAIDDSNNITKSIYFKNCTLYNASDERLKTFTGDIDIDLDKLSEIKKGIFYWNSDESKEEQLGVTAQSVKELFPQIVSENNGLYSVAYDRLGVIALAAIDKLHKENEELKVKIEELKSKIK